MAYYCSNNNLKNYMMFILCWYFEIYCIYISKKSEFYSHFDGLCADCFWNSSSIRCQCVNPFRASSRMVFLHIALRVSGIHDSVYLAPAELSVKTNHRIRTWQISLSTLCTIYSLAIFEIEINLMLTLDNKGKPKTDSRCEWNITILL